MIDEAIYPIPGRVALVPAASSGIGVACARALARAGARVAILSRDAERLAGAARQIAEDCGRPVLAVPGDLTDAEAPFRAVSEVARELGPVELLVANVGGPPPGTFDALDEPAWREAIDSVLWPAVRLSRAVLPRMRNLRFGRIVHVLSLTARQPIGGLTTSNALRPAVAGLVGDLARENAVHGITINAVCPGMTRTARIEELAATPERVRALEAMVPMGRLAAPEEIAAPVAFLCSEQASYLTGAIIPVDGGVTARCL